MHYLAIFGKFDRPGDSENVWDDRCEEGLEDQPIVQLGAWRLYHAECLHLVHLEIIYDSLHSLDPNNPEKEASWRTKNFALDHPKLTNKFIGQNFAPLQQYWDKLRHTTAESQYIWFSLISNWASGQWTLFYTTFRLVSQTSTTVALHGKLVTGKPLMIIQLKMIYRNQLFCL